jgi:hypothetical protein
VLRRCAIEFRAIANDLLRRDFMKQTGAAALLAAPAASPSSLYTFPSEEPPKGLARDRHVTGFPEFEQFYAAGFPAGTQLFV